MRIYRVLVTLLVLSGCTGTPQYQPDQLDLSQLDSIPEGQVIGDTISVHLGLPDSKLGGYIDYRIASMLDTKMLSGALEQVISKSGLFGQVVPYEADYVLDTWIQSIYYHADSSATTIHSIWRLIRVKDGKVLLCDKVDASVENLKEPPASVSASLRKLFLTGTGMLTDPSGSHVAMLASTGLWPSMGPAIPEKFADWKKVALQNWSKLHTSMSLSEVEEVIGPIKTSGGLQYSYKSETTELLTTSIYTVVFINGRLSRWEMRK